jgi:2-dehydropantoate 2-reductase
MKICVFGAGAIGGYVAVELASAGYDVCVIARGAHLDAIRKDGLKLLIEGAEKVVRLPASDDPSDFGQQDYVICTLKAHQAAKTADLFVPLLGPETAVVTAMNGIPWWYFHMEGGPFDGRSLHSVDSDGAQWSLIGPERVIGCVVDPACEAIAPGIIEHHEFNRFILGEPAGGETDRIVAISEAMEASGLDAPIRDGIRWNIWLKLWGNV